MLLQLERVAVPVPPDLCGRRLDGVLRLHLAHVHVALGAALLVPKEVVRRVHVQAVEAGVVGTEVDVRLEKVNEALGSGITICNALAAANLTKVHCKRLILSIWFVTFTVPSDQSVPRL